MRLVVLGVVTLLCWAPILSLALGIFLAGHWGCHVDEGSIHPCLVGGADWGPALYRMTVMGWVGMLTWLPALIGTLAFALIGLQALWRRARRT